MDLKQLGYYIWMDEQEKEEEKRRQEERELLEYYKYLHRIQKEDEEEQITVFGKYVYIFTSGRRRSGAGESKNIYTLHNGDLRPPCCSIDQIYCAAAAVLWIYLKINVLLKYFLVWEQAAIH